MGLADEKDDTNKFLSFFFNRGKEENKERSGNAAALRRKELCMILFELTCYVNDNVQLPE